MPIGPTPAHKFRIGQTVELIARELDRSRQGKPFVVTERFYHLGEPFYCVKSAEEPYERVLAECRLRTSQDSDMAVYVRPGIASNDLRFDRLDNELVARGKSLKIPN
jgi:hypothetical protein